MAYKMDKKAHNDDVVDNGEHSLDSLTRVSSALLLMMTMMTTMMMMMIMMLLLLLNPRVVHQCWHLFTSFYIYVSVYNNTR